MKIRQTYEIFAASFLLFFIVMGLVGFRTLKLQQSYMDSESRHFRQYKLAVELFQTSEDLTRMARSYVASGKPDYEKRYFEILDIRRGKLPRPARFSGVHWYLDGQSGALAAGSAVPLLDLMEQEGFTGKELALMRESLGNSDRLVELEKEAFAAVKGFFNDGRGNFTVQREPDKAYATELLFGDRYAAEKARIMAPIQKCLQEIDRRASAELGVYEKKLHHYILLSLALVVFALLGVELKFVHTLRNILNPIESLRAHVAAVASGHYGTRCEVVSSNEIGELCAHFNTMAANLENDIARRKKAEQDLARSFENWMSILMKMPFGIVIIDRKRIIRWANQMASSMAGMDAPEALQGRPCGEYLCPAEQNQCPILDKKQRVDNSERMLRAKSGRIIPIIKTVIETTLQGEDVLLEAFVDISARKKAEEALAHERQRLDSILKGTNAGTWEWNVQTGEVVFNERWAEIIGYTLAELAPVSIATWTNLAHPDDLKTSDALLERHFKGELPYYEFEIRMRHKDGRWIWVLDRGKVSSWTPDGKPLIMSGTHQDITARKQAEEKLDYMERIFLHDITNTAVALRAFAELVRDGRADKEMEQKFTSSAAFLSNRIIDEITAHRQIAAAEQGRLVLNESRVNSLAFLTGMRDSFNVPDMLKGCALVIDNASQSVDFTTDKALLGRVVGNMVKNAIEASRPGDQVTMGCFVRDKRISFWVHNPAWIPDEIRDSLFNRSFSTKGQGRGLGTYSMKILTEEYLKGRISFVSTREKGTTFTADYPLA